ncbi:hypothetical protein AcV7_008951 [Taiwanofungus camphoratus]|nr:hypothetical protein AcV7_008951 [Antrodia cinnamomea]
MRNPFIILRLVLFSFLSIINVLAFGFATWNIAALRSYHIPVDGAPIFAIFNACFLFFFISLSLAEFFFPTRWVPQVTFECVWTAASVVLQFACATDVIISGPTTLCLSDAYRGACASSALLATITWISCSILFLYFIALVSVSIAHATDYPAVWGTPICFVPWFSCPKQSEPDVEWNGRLPGEKPKVLYENPCFKADETFPEDPLTPAYSSTKESTDTHTSGQNAPISISLPMSKSIESFRPSWAKGVETRRGVDPPFTAPKSKAAVHRLRSYWSSSTDSAPRVPPKARHGSSGHHTLTKSPHIVWDLS